MAQTRTRRIGGDPAAAKVAITVRLDAARARQLQAIAEAENRTLTNYVETALICDLARRDEASRVITMYAAPGTSTHIDPDDVIRADDETDEAYAKRQALAVELWSIPAIG
jgi:predicted transcriptional regulator